MFAWTSEHALCETYLMGPGWTTALVAAGCVVVSRVCSTCIIIQAVSVTDFCNDDKADSQCICIGYTMSMRSINADILH